MVYSKVRERNLLCFSLILKRAEVDSLNEETSHELHELHELLLNGCEDDPATVTKCGRIPGTFVKFV
jgi:hypothetical protein